jgi:2-phospho-L-lactate guanylyltransferase (CobY/MobA/RfbA family)
LWPELNAEYAPLAMALASERGEEFARVVSELAAYEALARARDRAKDLQEELLDMQRVEAKLQRLLRTCENVVLGANLPIVAPQEIVERFEQLLHLEEDVLAPAEQGNTATQPTDVRQKEASEDGPRQNGVDPEGTRADERQ